MGEQHFLFHVSSSFRGSAPTADFGNVEQTSSQKKDI
jgi:hypothetical protein